MCNILCIKCTPELKDYVVPYLEKWGYYTTFTGGKFNDIYSVLMIGWDGKESCYGFGANGFISEKMKLITNVEEFLEKAAILKGFIYVKKI